MRRQGGVVQGLDAKLKPFFFPRRGAEDSHFFRIEAVGRVPTKPRRDRAGCGKSPASPRAGRRGRRYWKRIADTRGTARPGWTCGSAWRQCSHWAGRFIPARPSPEPEPMALQKVQPARESVPSRLGQLAPGVERDLLDPLAEALAEMDGECIPCMHQNGLSVG